MTKENKWITVIVLAFAVGIFLGGLYCAFMNDNMPMYEYLQDFIVSIKSGTDKSEIFKKTLVSDIKVVIFFMVCTFVRFGAVPICAVVVIKGFSVGFTFSALFKFFGNKGMLLILSQIPSELIFFGTIVFFGAVCSRSSLIKKDKGRCAALIAVFGAAILCTVLSAVCAGYLDVWLMEEIAQKLY